MCEHHLASSFGNPKAQPQTPLQTPTSLNFPSPVFDTPKQYQGSFLEPGSLTPRFAEEYSVFNSTPGNLRGSQGPFTDFLHATSSFSAGHKRLLSCEGLASNTAAHVDHVPSDSVDPSCRLTPSSAAPSSGPEASSADSDIPPSPKFSRRRSLKKFRQQADARRPDRPQFLSPPPSTHKDERRLALALAVNMPRDHFSQQENAEPAHHDMSAMIGNSGDLFAYPLSATASAPTTFWDPSMSMSMDMDFGVAGHGSVHAPHPSSHRHTGSFDWNAEIQLFQDVNVPAPTINQEGAQLMRRERLQASKPPSSGPPATSASESLTHRTALDDPFSIMDPGEGVDPGLLFGRPQTSALDSAFSLLPREMPAGSVSALSAKNQAETLRRTKSAKGTRTAKLPDRALAGSPIKSLGRPGLGRSYSENRGKRAVGRPTHPAMAAADASWSIPTAPKASGDAGASSSRMGCGRPSGRVSPAKSTGRMPMLASIPEAISQHGPRTSVRLNIDSYGRARAETTVIGDGSLSDRELDRARMARAWDSSDDDSSTDNEPIIIPSRSTSFTLPDPRQSVGSNFHPSGRGTSDRSRSNSANGTDSATETVIVLDRQHKGGDATSELRKVVEDRQKRSNRVSSARSHRFGSTLAGSFPSGIISPTSLADSNHGQGGLGVRCVCDDNSADETDCFMVQCESCDMWLHGSCVNVTRHTMPRVYICCFCMRTPKKTAKRGHESGLGVGGLLSPLASKSFHSFR